MWVCAHVFAHRHTFSCERGDGEMCVCAFVCVSVGGGWGGGGLGDRLLTRQPMSESRTLTDTQSAQCLSQLPANQITRSAGQSAQEPIVMMGSSMLWQNWTLGPTVQY